MNPQELKQYFETSKLPDTFKLSAWEDIPNVRGFLAAQFQIVEKAGIRFDKTPAWERLLRFKEAVKSLQPPR